MVKPVKMLIRLLARAVDDCVLLGVNSNKQFLVNLLRHPIIVAGDTNTAFIQQHFQDDVSLHQQVPSLETFSDCSNTICAT